MRLLTICIDHMPTLVMSTDTEPSAPDSLVYSAAGLAAIRATSAFNDALPADVRQIGSIREVDEALDGWLGEDLRHLRHEGRPLWDGDLQRIGVRDADADEAAIWRKAHQQATDSGEQEAGDEDYLVFLLKTLDSAE